MNGVNWGKWKKMDATRNVTPAYRRSRPPTYAQGRDDKDILVPIRYPTISFISFRYFLHEHYY